MSTSVFRDAYIPVPPQSPLGVTYALPVSGNAPGQLTWDALEEGAPRGYWDITGYDIQFRIGSEQVWHDANPSHSGTERRYEDDTAWKLAPFVHFRVRATNVATELKPDAPGAWSTPATARNLSLLALNSDDQFSTPDVLVMYYAYHLPELLGDGREDLGLSTGRPEILTTVSGLSGATDTALRNAITSANRLRRKHPTSSLDVNQSGQLTADDALIMYYAYTFSELLGNGDSGGTADFRRTFLSGLAVTSNPTDADLRDLLKRANALQTE